MRLSECKENMFSFAEREHSRSYHAAKIQNISKWLYHYNLFYTIQSFFLSKHHKKHISVFFVLFK